MPFLLCSVLSARLDVYNKKPMEEAAASPQVLYATQPPFAASAVCLCSLFFPGVGGDPFICGHAVFLPVGHTHPYSVPYIYRNPLKLLFSSHAFLSPFPFPSSFSTPPPKTHPSIPTALAITPMKMLPKSISTAFPGACWASPSGSPSCIQS